MPVHHAPASDSQSPIGECPVLVFQAAELWRGPTRLPQRFRRGSDAPWPHALEVQYLHSSRPPRSTRRQFAICSEPHLFLRHTYTINQSTPTRRDNFAQTLIPEMLDPLLVRRTCRFNEPRISFPNTDGLTLHEIARFLIALQYSPCRTKARPMPKYAALKESVRNWRRSCPMVVKLASNSR